MKNFQPGGLRNRRDDIGGRPRDDINSYAPKNRDGGGKPAFSKSFGENRSGGFNPKDRAPRETKSYPATCSDCGKSCDVPFRPDGVKPVLCRDCYSKKGPASDNSKERFPATAQRTHTTFQPTAPRVDLSQITKQLTDLEAKVTLILELVKTSEKPSESIAMQTSEVAVEKPKKVTKVVVKKAVAKKTAVKKVEKKTAIKKLAKKK